MNVSPPSRPATTLAWAASATRLFDAEQLACSTGDRRPPRRYTHRADRGPHSPRHAGTKPLHSPSLRSTDKPSFHANRATHNSAATSYRPSAHEPSRARHLQRNLSRCSRLSQCARREGFRPPTGWLSRCTTRDTGARWPAPESCSASKQQQPQSKSAAVCRPAMRRTPATGAKVKAEGRGQTSSSRLLLRTSLQRAARVPLPSSVRWRHRPGYAGSRTTRPYVVRMCCEREAAILLGGLRERRAITDGSRASSIR